MATLFRWLLRAFLVMAALGLLAGLVAYYIAGRSLPDYNARYRLPGLSSGVEIVRTNADVPHIFGGTDADSFFGLGFAHAQDRLWQMLLLRRTAQGRLSELFGEQSFARDELMRRLDLYGAAQASVASQSEPAQAALQAYAAGVNAWLAQVNLGSLGRGAPEFFLFSNEIAPWQPADSLAILKLLAAENMGQLQDEVLRARASLILPQARLADILPDAPGSGVAALPSFASLLPGAEMPRFAKASPDYISPLGGTSARGASNAWAAGPSRSASGASLLASDPHYGFSAPSIWYLARLELKTGGVIGATVPGLPLILYGRSDKFGWGQTAAWADDQDLFVEEVNPADPDYVRGPDGWEKMVTRPSIIRIRDAAPRTITLKWSANGPILPADQFDLASVTPRGHVMALGWTALGRDDTSFTAGLNLMQADTVDAGLKAADLQVAPAQNWVLADAGRVAMKLAGNLPNRSDAHQSRGRIPAPGWLAENRWQGLLPASTNPEFVDPPGGIVGNTNNKILDRPFPLHVSYRWGDTQRIDRWKRLMQARELHTRDSFIEAQLDTVSQAARALLPLVGADLWFTGEAAPDGTPERQRQIALSLLAEWNGEMNEHLPEPLIYAAWMRALQDRLIRDEMGPLARKFTDLEPVFIERVFRDTDGAAVWCDILQSAVIETCDDIARLALDDALVWIGETYGSDLASLRWGDVHQAAHDHAVLGRTPVLKWLFNIRQSSSGGDHTLMMGRSPGSGKEPFLNIAGAGYRGVYDFADPDSSVFIIATGQSGHPLSRHYDDLGVLWRRGEYIPMSLDPDLARAASVGITYLEPEGP